MLFRVPSSRVFDSCQSDSRVKAGLVGHWVGGGSGNTWFDKSGYGNHGALTNGSLWTLGRDGKNDAVFFDGVNDYVSLGSPSSLNLASDISVFALVNIPETFLIPKSSTISNTLNNFLSGCNLKPLPIP